MRVATVKKLTRKYFLWWRLYLGLGFWNLTLGFSDVIECRPDGTFLAGNCECDWKYLSAYITMYPKAMRHMSPAQIETSIVHELMHVLLNEMHEPDPHHEERVATQLQKALFWVRNAEEHEHA